MNMYRHSNLSKSKSSYSDSYSSTTSTVAAVIGVRVTAAAVVALVVVAVAATRGGTKIDPTKLAKVEKGDLAKSVVATGKVTPITKVEIKSKASGIVLKAPTSNRDQPTERRCSSLIRRANSKPIPIPRTARVPPTRPSSGREISVWYMARLL